MNKVSPAWSVTRSIPKHEKAAVTAGSNGLKCLGGEGRPPCLSQARTLPTHGENSPINRARRKLEHDQR